MEEGETMSGIENRVIHMTFDNAKFERDIAVTLNSLAKLKAAMDFTNAKKGLEGLSDMTRLRMTVDTSAVVKGLADVHGELNRVRNNMDFGVANRSLQNLQETSKKFHLGSVVGAVDGVSKKFLALTTIGITALATIASHAVTSALRVTNSFTFGPIMDGFREMETNMNSIQTILANTESKGTTLDDVNGALQQLNEYSDKTIYNFSQMARNIGTFTAAGVDLDTSVGAIKGIANLAAISGSNAEQASTAMYQLSQAIANGTLRLIDWTSVVNAGMGGEVFQKALFETGKAMGTLTDVPLDMTFDEWKKAGNSFRESLEKDWLTADVLTTTLQSFTGDLTIAQLKALGYTEEQAKEMERLGKLGVASATEVKTLTALLGTLKESVATGWSDSFKLIFGDFEESKSLFTGLNNTIGGFVQKNAKARNTILEQWRVLGGREKLLKGLEDAFFSIGRVVTQLRLSFQEVFPPITGARLFLITKHFADFMNNLRPSVQTLEKFRHIFDGVMAVLEIGVTVIKEVKNTFVELFQSFREQHGGEVLDFFLNLSTSIQNLRDRLVDEGGIADFFDRVTEHLLHPIDSLKQLKESFLGFFDDIDFGTLDGLVELFKRIRDKVEELIKSLGFDVDIKLPDKLTDFFNSFGDAADEHTTNSLEGGFDRVTGALDRMWEVAKKVKDILFSIDDALSAIWDGLKKMGDVGLTVLESMWEFAKDIGTALSTGLKSEELEKVLDILDTVALLLGGKGLAQIGKKGLGINLAADLTGGNLFRLGDQLKESGGVFGLFSQNMNAVTETLKTMQTQIKANALLKIAQALGLLTISVVALSFVNPESLAKSLTALAVGMGQLIGALALLNVSQGVKGLGVGGSVQFGALASSLVILAGALVVLTGAVVILAQLDTKELVNGLLALEIMILEIATLSALLSGAGPNLIASGVGMVAIATALVILGGALKIYATMDWEEIGKSMVVLTGALLILSAAMSEMSLKAPITAPAMIAIATSLVILGAALKIFATMDWEEIGKAMTVLGGSLLILSAAMHELSLKAPITGPAMIAIAAALVILGAALKVYATMDWEEIGKSMTVLFGSLLILAAAMQSMQGTIAGAFAIGVAAVSLFLLGQTLKSLAKIPWGVVGKGLAVMGVSLAALGIAATILQPAIPALFLLAAALLALGAGFALVGLGSALLAESFKIMADAGISGINVFMYWLDQMITRLPELISVFTQGVIDIAQQLLDALPAIIRSTGTIIDAILEVVIDAIPGINKATTKLIESFLQTIRERAPDFFKTAFTIIMEFLKGLDDNIEEIVKRANSITVKFLEELAKGMPSLVKAGNKVIEEFLLGMAKDADNIVAAGVALIVAIIEGIDDQIDELVDAAGDLVEDFIIELSKQNEKLIGAGFQMIVDFIQGIGNGAILVAIQGTIMIVKFLKAISNMTLFLVRAGFEIIIAFINGLADAIDEYGPELRKAGFNLAVAIADGFTFGLASKGISIVKKANDLSNNTLKALYNPWDLGSPSRTMIELGENIGEGLAIGLDRNTSAVRSAEGLSTDVFNAMQQTLALIPTELQSMDEFQPTITPVLDLTGVRATAGQIAGLIPNTTLNTGVSLQAAQTLASETRAREEAESEDTEEQSPREVNFTQNNYSPEALNTAKIHKQTRNLIALTKEELEIP
jgi:tape measure domain-containing protein